MEYKKNQSWRRNKKTKLLEKEQLVEREITKLNIKLLEKTKNKKNPFKS